MSASSATTTSNHCKSDLLEIHVIEGDKNESDGEVNVSKSKDYAAGVNGASGSTTPETATGIGGREMPQGRRKEWRMPNSTPRCTFQLDSPISSSPHRHIPR